ncbi:hypothetical protein PRBEI_2000421200 [Prionailurus iriomotensis]
MCWRLTRILGKYESQFTCVWGNDNTIICSTGGSATG